jgi:hypothetical protein
MGNEDLDRDTGQLFTTCPIRFATYSFRHRKLEKFSADRIINELTSEILKLRKKSPGVYFQITQNYLDWLHHGLCEVQAHGTIPPELNNIEMRGWRRYQI